MMGMMSSLGVVIDFSSITNAVIHINPKGLQGTLPLLDLALPQNGDPLAPPLS